MMSWREARSEEDQNSDLHLTCPLSAASCPSSNRGACSRYSGSRLRRGVCNEDLFRRQRRNGFECEGKPGERIQQRDHWVWRKPTPNIHSLGNVTESYR